MVAYGCQALVVVVDPGTVQCLQTLTFHKANVIKASEKQAICDLLTFTLLPLFQVSWDRDRHHHSLTTPYRLRLASVDSHSHCVVWDVTQGVVATDFSLGSKPLVDLQWLETNVSL